MINEFEIDEWKPRSAVCCGGGGGGGAAGGGAEGGGPGGEGGTGSGGATSGDLGEGGATVGGGTSGTPADSSAANAAGVAGAPTDSSVGGETDLGGFGSPDIGAAVAGPAGFGGLDDAGLGGFGGFGSPAADFGSPGFGAPDIGSAVAGPSGFAGLGDAGFGGFGGFGSPVGDFGAPTDFGPSPSGTYGMDMSTPAYSALATSQNTPSQMATAATFYGSASMPSITGAPSAHDFAAAIESDPSGIAQGLAAQGSLTAAAQAALGAAPSFGATLGNPASAFAGPSAVAQSEPGLGKTTGTTFDIAGAQDDFMQAPGAAGDFMQAPGAPGTEQVGDLASSDFPTGDLANTAGADSELNVSSLGGAFSDTAAQSFGAAPQLAMADTGITSDAVGGVGSQQFAGASGEDISPITLAEREASEKESAAAKGEGPSAGAAAPMGTLPGMHSGAPSPEDLSPLGRGSTEDTDVGSTGPGPGGAMLAQADRQAAENTPAQEAEKVQLAGLESNLPAEKPSVPVGPVPGPLQGGFGPPSFETLKNLSPESFPQDDPGVGPTGPAEQGDVIQSSLPTESIQGVPEGQAFSGEQAFMPNIGEDTFSTQAGWDAFLASAPLSENVEDRAAPDASLDSFIGPHVDIQGMTAEDRAWNAAPVEQAAEPGSLAAQAGLNEIQGRPATEGTPSIADTPPGRAGVQFQSDTSEPDLATQLGAQDIGNIPSGQQEQMKDEQALPAGLPTEEEQEDEEARAYGITSPAEAARTRQGNQQTINRGDKDTSQRMINTGYAPGVGGKVEGPFEAKFPDFEGRNAKGEQGKDSGMMHTIQDFIAGKNGYVTVAGPMSMQGRFVTTSGGQFGYPGTTLLGYVHDTGGDVKEGHLDWAVADGRGGHTENNGGTLVNANGESIDLGGKSIGNISSSREAERAVAMGEGTLIAGAPEGFDPNNPSNLAPGREGTPGKPGPGDNERAGVSAQNAGIALSIPMTTNQPDFIRGNSGMLDAELTARLNDWYESLSDKAREGIEIRSAGRTAEDQQRILDIRAAEHGHWPASQPWGSQHQFGLAVDINGLNQDARNALAQFGLVAGIKNDPDHIRMADTGSGGEPTHMFAALQAQPGTLMAGNERPPDMITTPASEVRAPEGGLGNLGPEFGHTTPGDLPEESGMGGFTEPQLDQTQPDVFAGEPPLDAFGSFPQDPFGAPNWGAMNLGGYYGGPEEFDWPGGQPTLEEVANQIGANWPGGPMVPPAQTVDVEPMDIASFPGWEPGHERKADVERGAEELPPPMERATRNDVIGGYPVGQVTNEPLSRLEAEFTGVDPGNVIIPGSRPAEPGIPAGAPGAVEHAGELPPPMDALLGPNETQNMLAPPWETAGRPGVAGAQDAQTEQTEPFTNEAFATDAEYPTPPMDITGKPYATQNVSENPPWDVASRPAVTGATDAETERQAEQLEQIVGPIPMPEPRTGTDRERMINQFDKNQAKAERTMTAEERLTARVAIGTIPDQVKIDLMTGKLSPIEFMARASGRSVDFLNQVARGQMPFGAGQARVQAAISGIGEAVRGSAAERAAQDQASASRAAERASPGVDQPIEPEPPTAENEEMLPTTSVGTLPPPMGPTLPPSGETLPTIPGIHELGPSGELSPSMEPTLPPSGETLPTIPGIHEFPGAIPPPAQPGAPVPSAPGQPGADGAPEETAPAAIVGGIPLSTGQIIADIAYGGGVLGQEAIQQIRRKAELGDLAAQNQLNQIEQGLRI